MWIFNKNSKRGRPAVDSEAVNVRIDRSVLNALDGYIASQAEPRPTRPESIRKALKDWLIGLGLMSQYDDVERLKQKIAELKPAASAKPSPAKGMAMLRRGRAKSDLAKAKNKRAKGRSEVSSWLQVNRAARGPTCLPLGAASALKNHSRPVKRY
jgi:hypothetical protein